MGHCRTRAVIVNYFVSSYKELRKTYFNVHVCLYSVCVLSCFSHIRLFVTLWTIAHQVHLTMGFSSQEYWSGLLFPRAGALPTQG